MQVVFYLQIQNTDGMPSLICLQCVHQVSRAFSFKQLCEQSDTNLRQYLGKPLLHKPCKQDDDSVQNVDLYSSSLLLDNFGLDDSSNDSDGSFKQDYVLMDSGISDNPSDEKLIAQRQLLKAAKMQKHKVSKKKLLAKNGGEIIFLYFYLTVMYSTIHLKVLILNHSCESMIFLSIDKL